MLCALGVGAMPKLLDPTLDVVFKLLFTQPGREDLLTALLTAVLQPPSPISAVDVLNPELEKGTIGDRGVLLDLRVRLRSGEQVNVEMQADRRAGMRKRVLYHWARLYGAQLVRGTKYAELTRCVSVFFLGYGELPCERFHSTFRVTEVHDHAALEDGLELQMVELPKVPRTLDAVGWQDGQLARWGRFFATSEQSEREELGMSDPVLAKANETLERLSADPEAQRLAQEREEAFLLYQFELNTARKEGEAKGRVEGRDQGQRAMVLRLVQHRFGGVPDDLRSRIEAASSEKLERWVDAIFEAESIDALMREG